MNLTDKHIRWCWDNNWFVDVVPLKDRTSKFADVKIEVHQRIEDKDRYGKPMLGTKTIQVGKEVFAQKTDKDKVKIYEAVNEVYKLIYNKYNERR